jgi:transcriptional regulator GlxA family with amidase domain
MVNEICKYCKLKSCVGFKKTNGHCPDKLVSLLKTLKESIHKPDCNVDYLIRKVPISQDFLYFLTKKYFGCTPKKLIENLKIELAIATINSQSTMTEVCNICGYNQTSTFKKAFNRRFGDNFSHFKIIVSEKETRKNDLISGLWSR